MKCLCPFKIKKGGHKGKEGGREEGREEDTCICACAHTHFKTRRQKITRIHGKSETFVSSFCGLPAASATQRPAFSICCLTCFSNQVSTKALPYGMNRLLAPRGSLSLCRKSYQIRKTKSFLSKAIQAPILTTESRGVRTLVLKQIIREPICCRNFLMGFMMLQ
jgi:hypothetical protein